MINFLSPHLRPSVQSDAVLDDDYLPDNLISDNVRKSNMGFMAYHVVKPPINLDFELACHADIQCLKIWSKVNSLKSTGFEILVKGSTDKEFTKIGHCDNLQEDGAIFLQQNRSDTAVQEQSNLKPLQFFRSGFRATRHAKYLRIRIIRTSRCVPVLRRVELWGHLSRTETAVNRRKFEELNRSNLIENGTDVAPSSSHSSDHRPSEPLDAISESITIPEEFLDSITCDIMSMPMVLPSGKIIDRLTLEKHNQQEEKWGRAPSDPYTGQCFTAERKPTLNAALKAQIDRFLLDHSNASAFRQTPRTVGSAMHLLAKRTREQRLPHAANLPDSEPYAKKQKKMSTTSNGTTSGASTDAVAANSLDEAVKLALRNITRYSTRTDTSNNDEKCSQCKIGIGFKNIFYKIKTCCHLLCKSCLTESNIKSCSCGNKFTNSDVERYHKTMLGYSWN